MSLRSRILAWLALLAVVVPPAFAQDEDEPYLPGLAAIYRDAKIGMRHFQSRGSGVRF